MSDIEVHPRGLQVLEFVDQYCSANSFCPDLREIMIGIGVASVSVVSYFVKPLLNDGMLDCLILPSGSMAPRTLHLTDLGMEMLEKSKKEGCE